MAKWTGGDAFRSWRKKHGISRELVADALGVTTMTIDRWDRNLSAGPRVAQMMALENRWPGLCAALGASPEQDPA